MNESQFFIINMTFIYHLFCWTNDGEGTTETTEIGECLDSNQRSVKIIAKNKNKDEQGETGSSTN